MRTLILAAALASTAMLSLPASAVEVCDKTCVGPACVKDCVREPSATVGRRDRDEVIIEERTRRSRDPGVEIREERRPGVEVEVGR
jgi:nitrate reductase beta subunit